MRSTSILLIIMSEIIAASKMITFTKKAYKCESQEPRLCKLNEIEPHHEMLLTETLTIKNPSMKKTICLCCQKVLVHMHVNDRYVEEKNVYGNYDQTYFCCPACKVITHTSCILDFNTDNKTLVCPNIYCGLVLRSNDINRLFAQMLYVNLSKKLPVEFFKKKYLKYTQLPGFFDHNMLMNIIIGSQTLHEVGKDNLLELLCHGELKDGSIYSEVHSVIYSKIHKDKSDKSILEPQDLSQEEIDELYDIGTILHSIEALWKQFEAIASPHDYLALYKSSVAGIDKPSLQKALSNHFMSFILNNENPFLALEEMLIEHNGCHDFVIDKPLTSEFLLENKESLMQPSLVDDVLSLFENNNTYKIETKAWAYFEEENKGVLIPLLLNYFANNRRLATAVEILKHQLAKLAVNDFICEVSPKNTLYVLESGLKLNGILEWSYVINNLNTIIPCLSKLENQDLSYALSALKSLIFNLKSEECNEIENIFVWHYTTDLGKIYVRCMPRHYFFDEHMKAFAAKRALYWNNPELEYTTGDELQVLRKEYLDEAAANQKMIQPRD
ncbi:hypothetical protein ENBRE01_2641 [Enteropsectra breve]|nr:hypothetical protein ENBRE01_2641 [Enteropsectra breve]